MLSVGIPGLMRSESGSVVRTMSLQSSPPISVSLCPFCAVVVPTKLEHSMYWSLSSSFSSVGGVPAALQSVS